MTILRVIWALVATLLQFVLLDLPLSLLGLVLIPIALACGAVSTWTPKTLVQFTWRIMWIYNNPEDGIDGLGDHFNYTAAQAQWAAATGSWSRAKRVFVWSALRNRAANLRSVPVISPLFDPPSIRSVCAGVWTVHAPSPPLWPAAYVSPDSNGAWSVVWQGPYVGVTYAITTSMILRFGWDLRKGDENGAAWIANRLPRARIITSIGAS